RHRIAPPPPSPCRLPGRRRLAASRSRPSSPLSGSRGDLRSRPIPMPNLDSRLDDHSAARGGGAEPPVLAAPVPAPLAAAPEGLPRPSPRQLGYRLPAEWEPHEATWLTFPHLPENWPAC